MWIGRPPRRIVTERPEPELPFDDGEPLPRSWVIGLWLVGLLVITICFFGMVSLFPLDTVEKATEVATGLILKIVLGFALMAWTFRPQTKRGRFLGVLFTFFGALVGMGITAVLTLIK